MNLLKKAFQRVKRVLCVMLLSNDGEYDFVPNFEASLEIRHTRLKCSPHHRKADVLFILGGNSCVSEPLNIVEAGLRIISRKQLQHDAIAKGRKIEVGHVLNQCINAMFLEELQCRQVASIKQTG